MRRYETVFIVNPDLSESDRTSLFERIQAILPNFGGEMVKIDEWGMKAMAYEINKKAKGYYTLMDYCGDGALVAELERFFRINDPVMRYMTVQLDSEVDMDALHQQMADEKAAAEAERKAREEAAQAAEKKAREAAEAAAAEAEKKAAAEAETAEQAPVAPAEAESAPVTETPTEDTEKE